MKNHTYTTNGALQYENSGEKCLDLFSKIGNMRHFPKSYILEMFEEAFNDNPELATQVAFWARAAREGAGERKTFFTILDEIGRTSPEFISDNARPLAELGYWKDLLRYFDIPGVVSAFARSIQSGDRLACKWAPRKGENARKLRDSLGVTNKQYRKILKTHSFTTEQLMSEKRWKDIEYSSVPGRAMRTYKNSFDRNDTNRFDGWKNDKTSKASVSATYPHQIWNIDDESLQDKLWNNLPDHIKPGERILPMIDVSGSMFGKPLEVAVSLGMYLAERNKSEFKDMFLTFSENPQIVKIVGDTLRERIRNISNANWDMNTDFEKAYRHILNVARKHDVVKDSMPTMILVLSDMQFDESQRGMDDKTHLSWIRHEYEQSGYDFPKLVFWNLDVHVGTPAECSDENVAMVSGFSPSIMKAILNVDIENFNPMSVMCEALSSIELDYTNLKSHLDIDYQQEI